MYKRIFCAFLALILGMSCLTGCGQVAGEIAGNVADAAKKELENQIRITFEKYKVEIVEMKTAVGKLNGDTGDNQFFCAVLTRSESDAVPQSVANSLSKLFHDAGVLPQSGSEVESDYLEHKSVTYKFSAFDDGSNYYTVFFYTDRIPTLEDLRNLISTLATEVAG